MTWLAQICMFLTLGLLATPSQFPAVLLPALAVALALTFLARPIAVWLCLLPYGFSRNETTFVAWVGLRGAVSILLAILPVIAQLPDGRMIFNGVFVVVIVSLLLQGWTIRPLAKWLGLIVPPRIGPVDRVELELPGRANHELVVYRIAGQSPVARGERIPRWARPALIVRDGQSIDFHHAGRLQGGDQVYIFTPPQQVRLLDRLFATPARLAEDDRDFFGDFTLHAEAPLAEVAESYGFALPDPAETRTVGAFLQDGFGGRVEVGDRLPVGGVELIVRAVDDENEVTEVGLALEPSRGAQPKLPVFQNLSEIAAWIRGWLRQRRARRSAPPAAPATEPPVPGTPPADAAGKPE
jgi:cell volume regulation protein A